MKKRPFTLFEVMVALSLMAILLGTLFGWYRHLTLSHKKVKSRKEHVIEERFADQRLMKVFSTAGPLPNKTPTAIPSSSMFFFTDSKGDLVFTFDHGQDSEPALSNRVLSKLFLDKESHVLALALWPLPEKGESPSKTLILLDHVTDLQFDFYKRPNPFKQNVEPQKISHEAFPGWQKSWKQDYQMVPSMMKVIITREIGKEKYTFTLAYELPYSPEYHHIYPKD